MAPSHHPNRDVVAISALDVDCVVGVYSPERDRPQPLRVDVECVLDTQHAAKTGRLGDTLDYAEVAKELAFLLEHCRFRLLESAADALCRYLLLPPLASAAARVESVKLRLTKPDALPGEAVASLVVERNKEWSQWIRQDAPFGSVDFVFSSPEATICRLFVAAGRQLVLSPADDQSGAALALSSGLSCGGVAQRRGEGRAAKSPLIYSCKTSGTGAILWVASPGRRSVDVAAFREIQVADEGI